MLKITISFENDICEYPPKKTSYHKKISVKPDVLFSTKIRISYLSHLAIRSFNS